MKKAVLVLLVLGMTFMSCSKEDQCYQYIDHVYLADSEVSYGENFYYIHVSTSGNSTVVWQYELTIEEFNDLRNRVQAGEMVCADNYKN